LDDITKRTFTFTFNPEELDLVNKKKFAELRDRFYRELEQLEIEYKMILAKGHKGLMDDWFERYRITLRKYDRYYVLADKQEKGTLDIKRGW
jgi:hypothetical protein